MNKHRIKMAAGMSLSAMSAAASAYVLLLYLSDASGSETFAVTSAHTGNVLCPVSALTLVAAVYCVCLTFNAPFSLLMRALPNAVIVLSLLVETLTVTNFFNHAMELITSDLSCAVIAIYAALSLFMSAALFDAARSAGKRGGNGDAE